VSPATPARFRKYARYADIIFAHLWAATDSSRISHAAMPRLIEEHQKREGGPERVAQKPAPQPKGEVKDEVPEEYADYDE